MSVPGRSGARDGEEDIQGEIEGRTYIGRRFIHYYIVLMASIFLLSMCVIVSFFQAADADFAVLRKAVADQLAAGILGPYSVGKERIHR